jgi:hypothetical protein
MGAKISDTSPEAERVQIEILRARQEAGTTSTTAGG